MKHGFESRWEHKRAGAACDPMRYIFVEHNSAEVASVASKTFQLSYKKHAFEVHVFYLFESIGGSKVGARRCETGSRKNLVRFYAWPNPIRIFSK